MKLSATLQSHLLDMRVGGLVDPTRGATQTLHIYPWPGINAGTFDVQVVACCVRDMAFATICCMSVGWL